MQRMQYTVQQQGWPLHSHWYSSGNHAEVHAVLTFSENYGILWKGIYELSITSGYKENVYDLTAFIHIHFI